MGRITFHILLMVGAAFALAGCGFADSHAPLPSFMRTGLELAIAVYVYRRIPPMVRPAPGLAAPDSSRQSFG